MKIQLDPLLGLRDFYPEDMRVRNWLFGVWKTVSHQYGFSEYDSALLEREELYTRKAGEEIVSQMYNFEDKDKNRVTLRPEMTPTLARMVMNKLVLNSGTITSSELFPLKWFSIPQCWRFETPQKGRKREHYQWNMDVIGVTNVSAEMELVSASVAFFEKVGLTSNDIVFKINSRKVLNQAMVRANVPPSQFAPACVILDKFDKVPGATDVEKRAEIVRLLCVEAKLSPEVAIAVVATRDFTLESLADLEGGPELVSLFAQAADYGIADWVQFDPTVVRGLAYYTGVVWEVFVKDPTSSFRAVSGGGRYDKLFSLYGSPAPVPCVGFGFGDCVIIDLLREKNLIPDLKPRVDFLVGAWIGMRGAALQVARALRQTGATVDVYSEETKKVGKIFQQADRVGATKVAFVAPDEWAKGLVRIKDLRSGDKDNRVQKDLQVADLANWRAEFD